MTNEMIAHVVNVALDYSIENHCIVWLLSNGDNLMYCRDAESCECYKNHGYWVAAIFEDGHRVYA